MAVALNDSPAKAVLRAAAGDGLPGGGVPAPVCPMEVHGRRSNPGVGQGSRGPCCLPTWLCGRRFGGA
jgi:hypothetical protein